eukprot:TRINITY_DN1465_c0_g1_i1.p1 TRINITY_DN1465_c0_g1~~TRINITY_DN1465_c0_g1_i1.p1  ORF type:complete len:1023 (-),score=217.72 TRINITY_DN1465_c0_g1_i1:114-3182(-)
MPPQVGLVLPTSVSGESTGGDASGKRPLEGGESRQGAAKEARTDSWNADGEREKDAAEDARPQMNTTVSFDPNDLTLNAIPTTGGRLLMSLSEAGLQYLVAGARANVGVRSGRYMFEVRIVEALSPSVGSRPQTHLPKQMVRIGLSTSKCSLFLGETADSISFDSEGVLLKGTARSASKARFIRDQVIGVLVNLDEASPNAHTISLFRDGQRICDPFAIPEEMRGQPLFPHINFRSVSIQVNFGPMPMAKLPFACRMLQGAAQEDVVLRTTAPLTNGKYDVVFPICLPDEGTFDWAEAFLENHPHFVELSDRQIIDWAARSGIWRPKSNAATTSNDRPAVTYGIPALDDLNARNVIRAIAPLVPRNYLIMEVKGNLIDEERKAMLKRFDAPHFRKIAQVALGEPSDEYKARIHGELLKQKQSRVDADWKVKKAEQDRRRIIKAKKKEIAEQRRAFEAEVARKRKEEAEAEAALAAAAKAAAEQEAAEKKAALEKAAASSLEGDAKEEVKDEVKEETTEESKQESKEEGKEEDKASANTKGEETQDAVEKKNEVKEEAAAPDTKKEETTEAVAPAAKSEDGTADAKVEKKEEDDSEEDLGTEPPKAELTEEEKRQWYRAQTISDLNSNDLQAFYGKFTAPSPDEGFDDIKYIWQNEENAKAHIRNWVLQKKKTIRIEELQPSEWFFSRLSGWQKSLQEWQMRQKEFKQNPEKFRVPKKKATPKETPAADGESMEVDQKEAAEGEGADKEGAAKEGAEKEAAEKEGAAKEGAEKEGAEKEGGEQPAAEGGGEGTQADAGEKDKASEQLDGDAGEEEGPTEDKDILALEDVCDMGNGEPLFSNFMFEDWALMSLRFELHLLVYAFRRDVNDPDRPSFHEMHLLFYYTKYYRKQLNVKFFGMNSVAELLDLISDCMALSDDGVLQPALSDEPETPVDMFVKLTEKARRERQTKIDAGDESAKLRFSVLSATPASVQPKMVLPPGLMGAQSWQQNSGRQWQARPQSWSQGGYRPLTNQRWQPYGGRW